MKSIHLCFAVTWLCLVASPALPQARGDALNQLQLRNPLPTPDQLQSIGFGAGVFIAADERGDVFTSPDGVAWTATANVGSDLLLRFAHGAGRFVAFSFSGNIFSSEDASIWTPRAVAPQNRLRQLVYGNGIFVAVGEDRVMTSSDGISWTTTLDVSGPGGGFLDVAYGNGIFAAVRNIGSIFTSVDGISWTPHQPDAGYSLATQIAFANGAFIALGFTPLGGSRVLPGTWSSINGDIWSRLSTNSFTVSQDLIAGGGTFVGISGFGPVVASEDGTNWAKTALPTGVAIQQAAYGNGVFVGVWPGYTVGSIMRSVNGRDWTAVPVVPADRSYTLSAGAYGAGRYVLVGPSVVTSVDGIHFTKSAGFTAPVNDVTFAAGQFVMVGAGGSISRSADGLAWSAVQSGTLKSLRSIAYGAGRYVSAGDSGVIQVSLDGSRWSGAWSGTDYPLHSVAFGGGQFVAVGHQGIVLTSPDGAVWTPQFNTDASTLHQVIFDGTKFVAVGTNGSIVLSANATSWTQQVSGITNSLSHLTYGSGLYVAVGSGGAVFSSTNAITWQERPELGVHDVLGSALLGSVWLLVGSGGTVYGTAPSEPLILHAANNPAAGALEITVSGCQAGLTYQLQSRTNLIAETWKNVTSFIPTQSVTVVPVPEGTSSPQGFYRVVTVP